LLAGSWSCLYVGSLLHLTRRNVEKATCIGMLSSVISLAAVTGTLIGGVISELFGFRATMYTAAMLAATGFFLFRTGVGRASISGGTLSQLFEKVD
ncbi:MAG: hypothetical protein ACE5K3_11475, partial [bacterium]